MSGWNGYFGGNAEDEWNADPKNLVPYPLWKLRNDYAYAGIFRRAWLRLTKNTGWEAS